MKTAITIFLTLILFSCKKEEEKPVTTTASLVFYSESGNFTIKYHDKDDWHTETVSQKNYTKTFEVYPDDITWGQHIVGVASADSLNIKGLIDGKTVQKGHRYTTGMTDLSVQLSNAK